MSISNKNLNLSRLWTPSTINLNLSRLWTPSAINLNLSGLWTPSTINFKDQEWLFPKNVLWPEKK